MKTTLHQSTRIPSPRRILVLSLLAGLCLLALLPGMPSVTAQEAAPAQAEAAPGEPAEDRVETKSLWDVYQSGGFIMHILALCSIGTIAVAVYCFIRINPGKMMPQRDLRTLTEHMRTRDVNAAYEYCGNHSNTFTTVVSAALLKVNFERDLSNKVSMEASAAETLDEEETGYMLWVNYLNIFATIAPMLGLLGTVIGMITSFDALAAGRAEPQDLAGGIGTAMSTTAGGLVVGIPAMFFYFFFRNRLMSIMTQIQKKTSLLIDIVTGELEIEEAAASEEAAPAETPAGESA